MSKRLRYVLLGVAILLAALVTWSYWFARTLNPRIRARAVTALEDRFHAEIQLRSLKVSFFPLPSVTGEDLEIRHKGWPDSIPLIAIRRFSVITDYASLIAGRNHIKRVQLYGLEIHIPPRGASAFKETLLDGEQVERSEEHTSELQSRFDLVCRL